MSTKMATRIVIKDTNSRKQVSYYQNTHQVGATDNAQHGTQIAEDTGELLNVGRKSRKAVEEREVQRKSAYSQDRMRVLVTVLTLRQP